MGIFGNSRDNSHGAGGGDSHSAGGPERPASSNPSSAVDPDLQLQVLTNDLITDTLTGMELKYFLDSDGDVGATWDDFIAYFFRMGEQHEILNSRVVIHRKFPVGDVLRLQTFCNDWNREKLWPKAYVRVAEEDGHPVEAQVIGEVVTDLEFGVAPTQLRQLLSCAVGTGSSLASAVSALETL
jgi:hypothetical protein